MKLNLIFPHTDVVLNTIKDWIQFMRWLIFFLLSNACPGPCRLTNNRRLQH